MGQVFTSFEFAGGVEGKPLGRYAVRPGYQETLRRSVVKAADRMVVIAERPGAQGIGTYGD